MFEKVTTATMTQWQSAHPTQPINRPIGTWQRFLQSACSSFLAAILVAALAPGSALGQTDPQASGAKLAEQEAVVALVPESSVTVNAVADGFWSDPATWGGSVPGAGDHVHIPEGRTVDFDVEMSDGVATVRIDGTLAFPGSKPTKLIVDTMVVTHHGHLLVGSSGPIDEQGSVEVAFRDIAGVPTDPDDLSLGLLSIGRVTVVGRPVSAFHRLERFPKVGDTTLQLAVEPEGWSVGDRLVLPATTAGDKDEVLTVEGIDGAQVTISPALSTERYSPLPGELKGHVAHLSRTVVFRSEVEGGGEPSLQGRGHIQLMHRREIDVRYARFVDLGRSDRSKDFGGDNIPQRYPLYVYGNRPGSVHEDAVLLVGNVVEASPGHGLVLRDGHFAVDDNVAYDIVGGGFLVEAGNETGGLRHNIAIDMRGRDGSEGHPKRAHGTQDYAGNGVGFWFQSRVLHNRYNVSAHSQGSGFIYFHRPTDLQPNSGVLRSSLEHPAITLGKGSGSGTVSIDNPPIHGFFDNEVYGCDGTGILVIKNSPTQGHGGRTFLEKFRAWNVQNGAIWDYTGHYLMRDFKLYSVPEGKEKYWTSRGTSMAQNVVDMTFDHFTIEGFYNGFDVHHNSAAGKLKFNSLPESLHMSGFAFANNENEIELDAHSSDHLAQNDDVEEGAPTLTVSSLSDLAFDGDGQIQIIATQSDSLGSFEYLFGHERDIEPSVLRHPYELSRDGLLEQGAYSVSGGKRVILLGILIVDRFSGERRRYELPVELGEEKYWDDGPDLGQLETFTKDGVLLTNNSAYAHFDQAETVTDASVQINVLSNDSDVEGDAFELVSLGEPRHGTVEDLGDGLVKYTPDPGFAGIDALTYTIVDADGSARETEGTVRFDVLAVPNPESGMFAQFPDSVSEPEPVAGRGGGSDALGGMGGAGALAEGGELNGGCSCRSAPTGRGGPTGGGASGWWALSLLGLIGLRRRTA